MAHVASGHKQKKLTNTHRRLLPGTSRRLLSDPFVGLHCEHLPASTVVLNFEQRTMSSANGASDALGMGPSAGYSLISVITVFCILTVSISMSFMHAVAFIRNIHMHIYAVTNLLMLYFCIKLIIKIPKFLTLHGLGHNDTNPYKLTLS